VARRVTRLAEQAAALAARTPDVVALQEVTARSAPEWREALAAAGLAHVAVSLDAADPGRAPAGPRRAGVLVASRAPLEVLPGYLAVPWPECALSVLVDGVTVHGVHVPNAANGVIKPQTLAALRAGMEDAEGPQILCGDLNTPRRETRDGEVVTFGQDSRGKLRPERGEWWDAAERSVVPGLADLGFRDAFRSVHGYAEREISWAWRRFGGGYRLDHVFCSAHLQPVAAAYHHAWREEGLSDHSALEADLA
jgi:endonuclease/exonuclease/phosphatase family metal-dependent hydrolase